MNEINSSPVSNKGVLACLGYSFEEWPKKKMQKGTKLEKFRSFRTSKQQKQEGNNEATNKKTLKLKIVLYMTKKKSNEKQSN